MSYEIKGHLLGFESMTHIELNEVDELFWTMMDADNKDISFTIINPYKLREYSFDLPSDMKVLLDIHTESNVHVYNIVMIQKPLENSTVNFLAPIVVNMDNNTVAQIILNQKRHPDFGFNETIKSFRK
ncbi:MAG: flagellar assembly protein FliW [Campylobacterota bacterium]|nr:flagellar assembly protein FliW [Campylobacterota bacterium]